MNKQSNQKSLLHMPTTATLLSCALMAVLLNSTGPEPVSARRAHGHQHSAAAAAKNEASGEDQASTGEESNQEATTESNLETGSGASAEASQEAGSAASSEASDNNNGSESNTYDGTARSGNKEEHTLLFYVISAISSIIGITFVLALISSSTVTMCAIVWQIIKMSNGGKKPSIG